MPVRMLKPLYREAVVYRDRRWRDTKTDEERRFYNSAQWRRVSKAHRMNEPLCRICAKEGRVTLGTLTDHITPLREGGEPFCESNLQTCCDTCHQRKRRHEQGR